MNSPRFAKCEPRRRAGAHAPYLFAGSIIGEPPEGADGDHQMWECEIIVIPRRKFKDAGSFSRLRIDQVLTQQFGKRERWKQPPYWERKDAKLPVFNPEDLL